MNRLFGKSLPLLLAILSTCPYGQEVTAQGRSWPVNYGYTPMRRSPPLKGFIVLTNGDTLNGYIKVFAFYDYYPILDTETNRVQDIYLWHRSMDQEKIGKYVLPLYLFRSDISGNTLKRMQQRGLEIRDSYRAQYCSVRTTLVFSITC